MESPEYQLAKFRHAIDDDGVKVIKMISYSEDVNESHWCVVMSKMKGYYIGEINKVYERFCFH